MVNSDRNLAFSRMPTAVAQNVFTPEALFQDWCVFYDYILEGAAIYQIRLEDEEDTVELLIKLQGTPRDPYIQTALKFYVKAAGLSIID